MTYGTEQRASIAEGREIAQETVTGVAKRQDSRKEAVVIRLAFHQGQFLVPDPPKEMRSFAKLLLQVLAAEIL